MSFHRFSMTHNCRILAFIFFVFLSFFENSLAQENVLYNGEWKADSYFTTFEGSWKIIQNETGTMIVFGEDFKAKKAPDLKVFLSKLELDVLDGDNASDNGTSVFIAKLSKYKGASSYEIPKQITISDYKTILVHCEKYAKFWGGSPLK